MDKIVCTWRGLTLEPGDTYFEWEELNFCSEKCVHEWAIYQIDPIEKVVGKDD